MKFLSTLTRFLDRVEDHLDAQKVRDKDESAVWDRVAAHLEREEAHQGRVEELLRVPNPVPQGGTARTAPALFRPPPVLKNG